MGNKFTEMMKDASTVTLTENGGVAYSTTNSKMLDFFGRVGALRSVADAEILEVFEAAFLENPELAVRCVFYARDIRGGLGERRTARLCLGWLAKHQADYLGTVLPAVAEYGRWDDFYVILENATPELRVTVGRFLRKQFDTDYANVLKNQETALSGKPEQPVSLMAKWLKSPISSNKATKQLGIKTAVWMALPVKEYKQKLLQIRKYLDMVESYMCKNCWEDIEYGSVPSLAMLKYRRAFQRHEPEGFQQYLDDVAEGKSKINSGTLYPYDIIRKCMVRGGYPKKPSDIDETELKVLDELWAALPDYLNGSTDNLLVMADVSGSMCTENCVPIATSIGLAIYFAQRSHGAFQNYFMTFDSEPKFVSIEKTNATQTIAHLCYDASRASWGGSTNFESALRLIVEWAQKYEVPQEDMPKALVCISDMEFDEANTTVIYSSMFDVAGRNATLKPTTMEQLEQLYKEKGYEVPKIVFWNVNSRNSTFHIRKDMPNVICISGQSPSQFAYVCKSTSETPYDFMVSVLSAKRYDMANSAYFKQSKTGVTVSEEDRV